MLIQPEDYNKSFHIGNNNLGFVQKQISCRRLEIVKIIKYNSATS